MRAFQAINSFALETQEQAAQAEIAGVPVPSAKEALIVGGLITAVAILGRLAVTAKKPWGEYLKDELPREVDTHTPADQNPHNQNAQDL